MTKKPPRKRGRKPTLAWAEWDAKLGTVPDRIIAEASGFAWSSVHKRRILLGIPAFRHHADNAAWEKWRGWDEQLGKRKDRIIAAEMGISTQAVATRRVKIGIMSFRRSARRMNKAAR